MGKRYKRNVSIVDCSSQCLLCGGCAGEQLIPRGRGGVNLYRAESPDGERIQIKAELIPPLVTPGSPYGAQYGYVDDGRKALKGHRTYYDWLEDVDVYGRRELHDPAAAQVD